MNRNRRNRDRGGSGGFGGDGLLGEGPPGPSMGNNMYNEPMVNPNALGLRDSQLLLAQTLLQQQQQLGGGYGHGGGGDFGGMGEMGGLGALAGNMGGMNYLQQQQAMSMGGAMWNDRKRQGGNMRNMDEKRRRRDSSGDRLPVSSPPSWRGDRDRSRGSHRSGEGRDRNRQSRWETEKPKDKKRERKSESVGEDDYDPAEPTEEEEEGNRNQDSNLYCHVCNISVYDDESFQRHLNGVKHKTRMGSILTAHQMKSNQLKSRLKAEEHLRKIERKGGRDPDYFCKICNNDLTIPWERHRYSNIHKQRLLQVRKGCGWCNVHDFTNFSEVLEHRETDEHKKNADLYGKKEDEKDRDRSRSRSRERKEIKEEDLTIPEYDAEIPVGLNYVIPVTGFFCKLCHKFYNNEKSAKGAHCQSEAHYEKFKAAIEAKIAAREKQKEEEAAAAAAAEEEEMLREEGEDEKDIAEDDEANDIEKNVGDDDDEKLDDDQDEDELMDTKDDKLIEDVVLSEDETKQDDAPEAFLNDADASSILNFMAEDGEEAHLSQGKTDLNEEKELEGDDAELETISEADKQIEPLEEEAESSAAPAPAPTTKARGTARRGRGRGKAKK